MSKKLSHKILIVDDEKDTCILLSHVLEKDGYVVESAYSAIEALDIIKDKRINLVITDLKMPEMDGIHFLRQARKLRSGLKFIIMTAYGEIQSYLDAINLGAFDYINKPMAINDVRIAIKKALNPDEPEGEKDK